MHSWRDIVCRRLAETGADPIADATLIEELAQHMEDRFAESQARGASADEAFAAALHELDHHERLTPELARSRRVPAGAPPVGGPPLRSHVAALWQDIRYAARNLRRSPGFTIAAVVTVALSTAPTIAALSVGNWLFLRPLPGVPQPKELQTVMFGTPSERSGLIVVRPTVDQIARITAASPSIKGMAGYQRTDLSVSTGNDEARTVHGEFVSASFFDVIGVRLSVGRSFLAEEDRPPDGSMVAVISHRLARALFVDRPSIGNHIEVNRHSLTVIGVAPRNFAGSFLLETTDIWIPGQATQLIQHVPPQSRQSARGSYYEFVVRRAANASPERVAVELKNAIAAEGTALENVQPGPLRNGVGSLGPQFGAPPSQFGAALAVLLGLGTLLVIIAAANLANIFGFRSVRRAHETAVRRALGASSRRLVQTSLAECIAVATLGCLAGMVLVLIAQSIVGGMVLARAFELPEVPLDWHLLWMTIALAFGVGVVMGLAPARLSIRKDLASVIGANGRIAGRTAKRLRTALAITQMALSLTLLVGALLFVGTLRNLSALDTGFDAKDLTAYELEFRTQGYSRDRITLFYQNLISRLSNTPGIAGTAVAHGVPMFGGEIGMERTFLPGINGQGGHRITYSQVSASYFDALGIALTSGRSFTTEEIFRPEHEESIVVSESLARLLYGTPAAVGRVLTMPATGTQPVHDVRIVGVAEDVRWDRLTDAPPLMIYRPLNEVFGNEELLVRSSNRPDQVIATVREAVKNFDPKMPMQSLVMKDVVSLKMSEQRIFAWVLGGLATIGFLLAAIGIHGLISQSVVERTREFGIRLAIGAGPREIVGLVLRSAFVVVAAGAPLGIALAALLARILQSRLFGILPFDPRAYLAAVATLIGVVIAAGLAPALLASRSNPADVLRAE